MMEKLLHLLARAVTNHRKLIIWGTLALFALTLLPIKRIHFSTDVLDLIPTELDSLQTFRELDKHFVQGGDLAILIESPSGDAESLAAFQRLFVEELRALPSIRGVTPAIGSSIDPAAWRWLWERFWLLLEPHEMDALISKLQPERIRASVHQARARIEAAPSAVAAQQVIHDPLGLSEVFLAHLQSAFASNGTSQESARTDAGSFQLLNLVTGININDSRACMRVMNEIRQAETRARDSWAKHGPHDKIDVGYTGRIAFTAEIATKLRANMFNNAFLSLAMVLFLFWIGFRNLYPLLGIAVTLIMAVLTNIVLCGLLFGGFNMISGSFAAILVGLGDYGILIYNRYALARNDDGLNREEAILHTARATVPGILLGATTTATAFLGMTWTSSPGFRQFGWVVAMGIALCTVLMTVFYFALIAGRAPRRVGFDLFGNILQFVGNFVMHHRAVVLTGTALAILAAVLIVLLGGSHPGVGFDADPHSLRFKHSPAFDALEKTLAHFNRTSNPCVLLIGGKDWTEVAETTGQLRARLQQAKASGFVQSFESPSGLMPAVSQQKRNAGRLAALDWSGTAGAFRAALAAEGFRVEEFQPTLAWLQNVQTNSAAPDSVLLTPSHWLEHGGETAMMAGRYVYAGAGVVETATYVYPTEPLFSLDAIERLSKKLGVDGHTVRLTNWDALILEMQPVFRRDFLRISLVVFVAVVIVIWLGYRKLKPLAFLAIPVGGALLCILAVMKLCGIKFNLANFFAVPIVIGAGVDYAIHMLNGVEEENGDGIRAIRITGKAVTVNALTTMIGFGSLMMTDHTGLATLGLLTTLGIFFCLVFSVIVLPLCVSRRALAT